VPGERRSAAEQVVELPAPGADGRFATHPGAFGDSEGPVVLEVCGPAPGALVSEMARAVCGVNLETGCLRTLSGAEQCAAIRSYITTAARDGQNMLDALIQAADGHPWICTWIRSRCSRRCGARCWRSTAAGTDGCRSRRAWRCGFAPERSPGTRI